MGLRKWLRLFGMLRIAGKVASASKHFAEELRRTHIPDFAAQVDCALSENIATLEVSALLQRLHEWIDRTLVKFARQSLKPTLLAQFSWQVLEQQIAKSLGADRAREALSAISQGAAPDPEADLPRAIRELVAGNIRARIFSNNSVIAARTRWSYRRPAGRKIRRPCQRATGQHLHARSSRRPAAGKCSIESPPTPDGTACWRSR